MSEGELYFFIDGYKHNNMENKSVKEPEVNKDLFCLSINDVLKCCYDDSAGGGILYLHYDGLVDLVKEKLK